MSRTTSTVPTMRPMRPSASRSGAALAFSSSSRPSSARADVRAGSRDHLPAQRPSDGGLLAGDRRTRGCVAHLEEAGPVEGRQGLILRHALESIQLAIGTIDQLHGAGRRVILGHPVGDGLQDGVQALGTAGRLRLADERSG